MKSISSSTRLAAAAVAAVLFAGMQPAAAADMTAVEKLYAELGKLDKGAREARLLEGAAKEDTFNLLKSLRGKLGRDHLKLFKKRYPQIKIKMSELGSQDAAERLRSEDAAGRLLTDVVGLSLADMSALIKDDVPARYPTPANGNILQRYHGFMDKENRWVVWYWSEHGIVYNTNLVKAKDAPKAWMDLCSSKYKGQISFDPPETRFMTSLLNVLGKEKFEKFFECIGKNEPIIMRGHTVRLNLMLAGDHGLAADQYFYKGEEAVLKNPKKAPFKAVYSAEVLATAGANIINQNTPHPYTSALYTDWAVGKESQQYLKSKFRGPVGLTHPYMPDSAVIVAQKYASSETVAYVHAVWKKYMGAKR